MFFDADAIEQQGSPYWDFLKVANITFPLRWKIVDNMHVQQRYLMHDITSQFQHFQHTILKISGVFVEMDVEMVEETDEETDYLKWNFALMINSCDWERLKKITFDFLLLPDALRLVSERYYKLEQLKILLRWGWRASFGKACQFSCADPFTSGIW